MTETHGPRGTVRVGVRLTEVAAAWQGFTGPVKLAVTLVIDKGTAPRSPVTDVLIPK